MPLQLLPLTQHLMYPWLYFEPVPADVTKWAESSYAVKFWQAMTQPTTTMMDLSKVIFPTPHISVRLYSYKITECIAATSMDNGTCKGVNYGCFQ